MSDTTDSAPLYERTLQLARSAPRHVKQGDMARACGVSDATISRFVNDKHPDASVRFVQCLHDFLLSVRT